MTPQTPTTTPHRPVHVRTENRLLHYVLWVAQILMAVFFAMVGWTKLSTSYAELAANMAWVSSFPEWVIRAIGAAELLAALGLVIPPAVRFKPKLAAVAATGLFINMVGAFLLHLSRGESVMLNVILGLISAFIAWGRFSGAPIADRNEPERPGTIHHPHERYV